MFLDTEMMILCYFGRCNVNFYCVVVVLGVFKKCELVPKLQQFRQDFDPLCCVVTLTRVDSVHSIQVLQQQTLEPLSSVLVL